MHAATVLIVGTGRTGLTLACDLRSRGIDAQVIDKAAGPATTSRALGLQPRGREILDRLGALGDLPDRAVHAYATNILLGRRLLTRFVVETQRGRVDLGPLLISQAEIEAQLRRRLAELGGHVRWSHELVAAKQDSDGVGAWVRTAEREHAIRAKWLDATGLTVSRESSSTCSSKEGRSPRRSFSRTSSWIGIAPRTRARYGCIRKGCSSSCRCPATFGA